MIGAASHTPTQEESIQRHLAFKALIAARAVPDPGICLKRKPPESVVVPIVKQEPMAGFAQTMNLLPPLIECFDLDNPLPVVKPEPEPEAPPMSRPPTIIEIQVATAKQYGVSRLDILGERRTANVVRPRQVAMYLSRQLTARSLPEIGRRFGMRDHTTVLHGVTKISQLLAADAFGLAVDIEAIKSSLPRASA
jgi:hypothetical protein